MRPLLIGLALSSGVGLLFAACTQDPVSAATSTSGTGGAPSCEGVFIVINSDASDPCNICMKANCCPELAACRDDACILCANITGGPDCTLESILAEDCANRLCLSTCSPGVKPPTSSSSTSSG